MPPRRSRRLSSSKDGQAGAEGPQAQPRRSGRLSGKLAAKPEPNNGSEGENTSSEEVSAPQSRRASTRRAQSLKLQPTVVERSLRSRRASNPAILSAKGAGVVKPVKKLGRQSLAKQQSQTLAKGDSSSSSSSSGSSSGSDSDEAEPQSENQKTGQANVTPEPQTEPESPQNDKAASPAESSGAESETEEYDSVLEEAKLNPDRSYYLLPDARRGNKGADPVLRAKTEREMAVNRFRYLLGLSDLFKHFVDVRAQRDPEFASILAEAEKGQHKPIKGKNSRSADRRHAAENEGEDIMDDSDDDEPISVFTSSPSFVNGKLREYQIDGLNWMVSLHKNSISGILADEMGLGKTFQTVALLAYLYSIRGIEGPHLILVPKSTINNWARELEKWAPQLKVLVITGDKTERADLIRQRLLPCEFNVCVTSFELAIREQSAMRKFAWHYIIVDEGHRIKNEDSILSKIVRILHSTHRLLITGTPLQNNLHELWSLLNFLLPDVFADSETFDEWFQDENEDQDDAVKKLHMLLHPFLLRRVKIDVEHSLLPKKELNLYVGMTEMQMSWYKSLLERDLDAVNGTSDKREGKVRLLNVVMQLRKCCNHPYLFDGAEPGPPYTTDEHIVQNSGKMIILDKLLAKLKGQGSRVLIFSQMSRMLDILEDFCGMRGYEYCRIDGSTLHEDRVEAIDEFNKPGSDKFVFLLTTRAGGLGINLTTADQVVLFDSDWNPQADLQAMDRAHRIGQTKQVFVYRFVTSDAIEEKILERAAQKLRLDQLVIQEGHKSSQEKARAAAASKGELADMIRHGAQTLIDGKHETIKLTDIDEILKLGEEKTQELSQKYSSLGLDDLRKFSFDHPTPLIKKSEETDSEIFRPHRRERVEYNAFPEKLRETKMRTGRPPRTIALHDYQFYPRELEDLQERELAYYRKQLGFRVTVDQLSDEDEEACDEMNQVIEDAVPLTAEEQELKDKLIAETFNFWSKRDFLHFVVLCTRYGRDNLDEIVKDWPDKSEAEIRRYHKTFFERFKEIQDYERYMKQIEIGEERLQKVAHQADLLRQKITSCEAPLSDLKIVYPVSNARKTYSEDEDRFLLVSMNEFGMQTLNLSEKIRDKIRTCGLFDFDWFFLSRTPTDINRRCSTLLTFILREADGPDADRRRKKHTDNADDDDDDADGEDADDEVETEIEDAEETAPQSEVEIDADGDTEMSQHADTEDEVRPPRKSLRRSSRRQN